MPGETIAAGDLVIAYTRPDALTPVVVRAGEVFTTRHGEFSVGDMIGRRWGTRLRTAHNRGFVYLLRPTPELWTRALPHRTQILYHADISLITTTLDLRPGSVVVEAGTGSGSFTHSLARAVAPTGRVHTCEFHRERAERAAREFSDHGLDDVVATECRDVCADGFPVVDAADAVFLDLPAPWDAVPHLRSAFAPGVVGRVCCFSPCMEQVLRTAEALKQEGFHEIKMFETLSRYHDVRPAFIRELRLEDLQSDKPIGRKRRTEVDAHGDELLVSKVVEKQSRGHTSYLTFAKLAMKRETEE